MAKKRNQALRSALQEVPEDVKIFVRRQVDMARRIREIMESNNLTQKSLAKRLSKQESEISKWLSGEHNLTLRSLAKLEAALGEPILEVPDAAGAASLGWKKIEGPTGFTISVSPQKNLIDKTTTFSKATVEPKAKGSDQKQFVA